MQSKPPYTHNLTGKMTKHRLIVGCFKVQCEMFHEYHGREHIQQYIIIMWRGRRGRDRMIHVVGFTTNMQSVPINNKVVSSNPAHGEVYWTQLYVMKFVSDLW